MARLVRDCASPHPGPGSGSRRPGRCQYRFPIEKDPATVKVTRPLRSCPALARTLIWRPATCRLVRAGRKAL